MPGAKGAKCVIRGLRKLKRENGLCFMSRSHRTTEMSAESLAEHLGRVLRHWWLI